MSCKDKSTKSFQLAVGLKQGDIFSTVFFKLYINDIPSVLDDTRNDIKRKVHLCRSSRPKVFCKKDALRNFPTFTGKHLCQSLCSSLLGLQLYQKETLAQVFSCEFCQISERTFFTEQLWWLLLCLKKCLLNALLLAVDLLVKRKTTSKV